MSEKRMGENNPNWGKFGKDNPNYGKTRSEETRDKIAKGHIGKPRSQETRDKISEGRKDKKAVAQIDPETNEIIAVFGSLCKAMKKTGIDRRTITKVCKGEIQYVGEQPYLPQTAGGFKWKFVNID